MNTNGTGALELIVQFAPARKALFELIKMRTGIRNISKHVRRWLIFWDIVVRVSCVAPKNTQRNHSVVFAFALTCISVAPIETSVTFATCSGFSLISIITGLTYGF